MNKKFYCSSGGIALIAVMTALSIVSRTVFIFVPHFKPLCAMVMISGIYLGRGAGFICGALSILISNFTFGQGPWTPFQMLSLGLIGLLSGIFAKAIISSKPAMIIASAFAGVLYSAIVDIWTALWADGTINIGRYLFLFVNSLPVIAIYVVSNAIFMIVLCKPLGKKIVRVKQKYGI